MPPEKLESGGNHPSRPDNGHAFGTGAEDALMARVTSGDETAFEQLMTAHIDRVYGIATRMLGNESDAEDVAQEVFLRLWRHAAQWQPNRAKVYTWLYKVTANLCLDRLRRRQTQSLDGVPEQEYPPEQQITLEEQELSQHVMAALQSLPDRQRLALVLCHYEELPQKQVADIMESSVEALESLLARGRRALRAKLQQEWKRLLPDNF